MSFWCRMIENYCQQKKGKRNWNTKMKEALQTCSCVLRTVLRIQKLKNIHQHLHRSNYKYNYLLPADKKWIDIECNTHTLLSTYSMIFRSIFSLFYHPWVSDTKSVTEERSNAEIFIFLISFKQFSIYYRGNHVSCWHICTAITERLLFRLN